MDSIRSFYPVLATVAAYLVGSLSFAVIVSRAMGLNDPRTFGSKNPGATNVLRSGSKIAAIVTLLLDAAKGWLPIMLVKWYGNPYGLDDGTVAMVGLAAFVGHLYPVFFKFVGGKGVATALGVLVGVHWALGLAAGVTWLLMALVFRFSSLASLAAAVLAPVYYIFGDGFIWPTSKEILLATAVMSMLLIYRHAENISRLAKGTESRLGKKKHPHHPHDLHHKHKPD